MSFRFTDCIRRDMLVRDVRNRYPQTHEVFDRLGVRTVCWDCSVGEAAHRSGIGVDELLGALHAVIAQALAPTPSKDPGDAGSSK